MWGRETLLSIIKQSLGKGTIISNLTSRHLDWLGLSVSHTSRPARPGEIDGVHYHFVTKQFMQEKIAMSSGNLSNNSSVGFFLESARVHGNLYGTSFAAIEALQKTCKTCILDVDVNGVKNLKSIALVQAQQG